MKIMFLGTSSNAGKTLTSAVFCRYLTNKGIDTVPFKASNLSSETAVTDDGKLIGIGQAFQAVACGKKMSGDMNPVLIRPTGGRMETRINSSVPYDREKDSLSDIACKSFDVLASEHEAVVCEGSGSPAEINLRDRDIANMRMVRRRDIPAILVGDIERGGVFAAIYGTWLLTEESDRKYLRGFVINRFRGEPSVLKSGIERIESLTGMKCLGVAPLCDLKFPEEDIGSDLGDTPCTEDYLIPYVKNLDMMLEELKGHVDFEEMERIASLDL